MANPQESRLGSVLATARGALGMAEAAAEDSIAAVDLFGLTDAEGPPADPFAAREPRLHPRDAPHAADDVDVYFRADVSPGWTGSRPRGPCSSWATIRAAR